MKNNRPRNILLASAALLVGALLLIVVIAGCAPHASQIPTVVASPTAGSPVPPVAATPSSAASVSATPGVTSTTSVAPIAVSRPPEKTQSRSSSDREVVTPEVRERHESSKSSNSGGSGSGTDEDDNRTTQSVPSSVGRSHRGSVRDAARIVRGISGGMDEVTSKNVMGDARGNKNSSEGSRGTSR